MKSHYDMSKQKTGCWKFCEQNEIGQINLLCACAGLVGVIRNTNHLMLTCVR